MECPKCRRVHPDDAYFCARCGVVLPCPDAEEDQEDPNGQYCLRCRQSRSMDHPTFKPRPPDQTGPSKVRKPLLWFLAVTVVVWLGVMAWHFLSEDKYLNMKFVIVPQGCFQMGSDDSPRTAPKHEVCVDWFYMSQFEVTQSQWESVMGHNPSSLNACGENCPVNGITWEQVQVFINKLNARGGDKFRLPTEAEWEYACRGGARQRYCGSDDADLVAWHSGNARGDIHPVGQKAPNGFRLFDMSGNVWEWVTDHYDERYYAISPKSNPKGSNTGALRIFRGGSIKSSPEFIQPTQRNSGDAKSNFGDLGFRLVRIP
ncbi:MAG: SUMF1/EgtB/PvdO family nonheme iron enzyme [Magnetococcales bacterium]|nr:SUMF1/EgtB/PvdO family nonheme iron enzyme [Magnetococcales bacterium]